MIIFCSRKTLKAFRKECRERYPNEHFAALYGKRSDNGDLLVTRVSPVTHTSNSSGVMLESHDILKSKRAALRKEEDWLGTIHSHCFESKEPTCWHLSEMDIKTALIWGEVVCGLVYVYDKGRHTSVHWYIPQPLPKVCHDERLIREVAGL